MILQVDHTQGKADQTHAATSCKYSLLVKFVIVVNIVCFL